MKTLILFFLVSLWPAGVRADSAEKTDLQEAEQATAALAASLRAELVKAMTAGGPLAAIEVCHLKAPEISSSVVVENGIHVGRVSLKNRNPDNAPSDWQQAVLLEFEARKQAGEAPGALSWQENPSAENGQEFRYMKAIPTADVCLHCHGEAVADPVAAKIAALYPEDRATGYRSGDIRGAFVVIRRTDASR
jgi:hypothetical protein